ncbi:hypothetical protein ACP70R_006058 [Stipagrostis hirtigluma subsp. patula]
MEASGSSTNEAQDLPLVDCPRCKIPVIRRRSKQPGTYGRVFYKCENNIKDDPTSCDFYKFENEYKAYLRLQRRPDRVAMPASAAVQAAGVGMPGSAAVQLAEVKHDVLVLKQQTAELMHKYDELKLLKEQIGQLASTNARGVGNRGIVVDSAVIVAACVGCIVGMVIAVISKM